MSFANTDTQIMYNGTGAKTNFLIPFPYASLDYVKVEVWNTVTIPHSQIAVTRGVDYSVINGEVVFISPPLSTGNVLIYRETPADHPTHYSTYQFPYETVNKDLDRLHQSVQEVRDLATRANLITRYDEANGMVPPTPAALQDLARFIGEYEDNLADIEANIPNIQTLIDDVDALEVRATSLEISNAQDAVTLIGHDLRLDDLEAAAAGEAAGAAMSAAEAAASAASAANSAAAISEGFGVTLQQFGAVGDGVADDTLAFQAALDYIASIGGGTIRVVNGTYKLTARLEAGANTTITCDSGAVMRRSHNGSMLTNGLGVQLTAAGYAGNGNISIIGGTWDGNGVAHYNSFNHFAIGYATNFLLKDVTCLDGIRAHAVDLSSCRNVLIDNCKFIGFATDVSTSTDTLGADRTYSEAIQIDTNRAGSFSFGLLDGSPCLGVTVRNCYFGPNPAQTDPRFGGYGVGVGGHGAIHNVYPENIQITGCVFESCRFAGVRPFKWRSTIIKGNLFKLCKRGVHSTSVTWNTSSAADINGVASNVGQSGRGMVIEGNIFTQTEDISIFFPNPISFEASEAPFKFNDVVIANNTFYDSVSNGEIDIRWCNNLVIKGNIFRSVHECIQLEFVSNVVIASNIANSIVQAFIFMQEINPADKNRMGYTSDIMVNNNLIKNLGYSGINMGAAIRGFSVLNNQITNASTFENTRYAINLHTYNTNGLVSNNIIIDDNAAIKPLAGINLSVTTSDIEVRGNTVQGNFINIIDIGTNNKITPNQYNRPVIKPNLNIDFTASETLDSRFTFTRASTAHRVNSLGMLESVAINVPRFDYDPSTLSPRGILHEKAATNLFTNSEEYDNAAWVKARVTVVANAALAPDGTMTAEKIVESTDTNTHYISHNATIVAGTRVVVSHWVKAAGGTWAHLALRTTAVTEGCYCSFNLNTGTVGTLSNTNADAAGKALIEAFPDGWYRIQLSGIVNAVATTVRAVIGTNSATGIQSYAGDGTSGIFATKAQLEVGDVASSYIRTTTASATRAEDSIAMTGTNFSTWFRPTEGTFVVRGRVRENAISAVLATISDGTANNRMVFHSAPAATATVTSGGAEQALLDTGVQAIRTPFRMALSYRLNSFIASRNGSPVLTDTLGAVPTVNRLYLLRDSTGVTAYDGHIYELLSYPRQLTASEVRAIAE